MIISASPADFYQEKLEGVINLPESLEVTKSILSFFYTSSYEEDRRSPTKHSAGVYVAAEKYEIPALKPLALTKLVALFRSLESRIDKGGKGGQCTQEMLTWLEKFLEVVVLVYNNTQDNDNLRPEIVSTAREILRVIAIRELLRLQQLAVSDDAWVRCFELAPAFALDLAKPVSVSLQDVEDASHNVTMGSRLWRAQRDCMIFECGNCHTAVIMSKESWEGNGGEIASDTNCPNYDYCKGLLEHEISNC